MPTRSPKRSILALVLLCAGCSTCQEHAPPAAEPPPRYEARSGVPFLMDIPVIGVLFGRRTIVR